MNDFDIDFNNNSDSFGEDSFDGDSFGDTSFDSDESFGSDSFGGDSFGGNSFDNELTDGLNSGENAFDDYDLSSSTNSNSNNVDSTGNDDDSKVLQKKSIIIIAAGIVGIIVVICIASLLLRHSNNDTNDNNVKANITDNNDKRENRNVDDIVSTGKKTNTTNVKNDEANVIQYTTMVDNDGITWTEISDSEDIKYNDEYTELTFTITRIKHYARVLDDGSLVVKSTINGSLSGMSGTYSIDLPYSKGIKLVAGDSFTVQVEMGSYNNKTVIGDIIY